MKAFRIEYKCGNCGHEWSEDYEKGDVVRSLWDGVVLDSHKCEHHIGCKYCRRIECPVCGCDGFPHRDNHPEIVKRIPLKEA